MALWGLFWASITVVILFLLVLAVGIWLMLHGVDGAHAIVWKHPELWDLADYSISGVVIAMAWE